MQYKYILYMEYIERWHFYTLSRSKRNILDLVLVARALQPGQCVGECPELPVDVPHVLHDLLLVVQQLDVLGVRVVASGEAALDGPGELPV